MLSQKISRLMELVGAKNSDIAINADFDQSNISRLRSGARIPEKRSTSINKFANGLIIFSKQIGKIEILCNAIGCDSIISHDEIKDNLLEWLYNNLKPLPEMLDTTNLDAGKLFGERLNVIMEVAEISNASLSKSANIDPSYLSRMRNGSRLPNEKSKILNILCEILIKQIIKKNKVSTVEDITGISSEFIKVDHTSFLIKWMLNPPKILQKDPIHNLISKIERINFDSEIPIPKLCSFSFDETLKDSSELYHGVHGLQKAVSRFLYSTLSNYDKEILLYSDQNMDWMNGDYHIKWLSLMCEAIKRGVKIRIIHNIERSSNEILEAVASWLPLYISGIIESYYYTKNLDNRLSYTMFLNPNRACIEGVCVNGFEKKCDYRYITDNNSIDLHTKEFEELIRKSKPLICINNSISTPSSKSIQRIIGNVQIYIENDIVIINKLSPPHTSLQFDHPILLDIFRDFI